MGKQFARRARCEELRVTAAVEETVRLYHAWLGYLLIRLGSETLRVRVDDIRTALDSLSCSVTREGDEYVIRLGKSGEEVEDAGDRDGE